MRNASKSVGGGGESLDYAAVAHTTVTTPLVTGKEKRKAAAKEKEGNATKKEDKENQKGPPSTAAAAAAEVPPNKRAKTDTKTQEGGGGGKAAAAAGGGAAASSVRYPRLNYAEMVDPKEKTFTSEDISEEEKVVYLAKRVMEADTLKVEEMLLSTKYNHLSHEMSTYASLLHTRLQKALQADKEREAHETAELSSLLATKKQAEEEVAQLDKKLAHLHTHLAEWEALGKVTEEEGKRLSVSVEKKRKEVEGREKGEEGGGGKTYESPTMKEVKAMMEEGKEVKTQTLTHVESLMSALEEKVPGLGEMRESVHGRQREVVEAFQGAQFAGLPNVEAPGKAAKVLTRGAGKKK